VLGEALLVGLTASIGGLGLGVLAATGLRDLAGMFGIALPPGAMVLSPRTVLIAFAVGVLITLTAAAGPARRAAQVAPVTAMRESSTPATGGGRARTAAGLVAMVLGTAALGAVLAGAGSILLLGMSAAATIAGLSLLGPVFAPVLARLVGRPLDAAGVPGRLARESAARAPRRTAATAMALALGLALISFTTVVASSVKASIRQSYGEVISADYVIESGRNEMLGGLPAHLHHHVANLPQVAVASRLRYGHWKDGQATRALTAIDPATLPQVTSLHLTAGTIGALAGGGIVLADHVAIQHHLGLGDTLVMTFARTGAQRIPIVGVLRDADAQALSTDYIISLDTYARHYTENLDASIFVKAADGVRPADATTAIRSALTDAPTAQLRDQAAAVAGRTQTLDRILGLVTALLLLTIVIALLGITNTLALSIIERTREIGLLRAVGMTRSQLRWMIRGEAVVVAALATVLGFGLGIGFAAATVAALGSTTPIAVVLPAGRLLLVVGVALAAGLLAGLLPARRAARLDVLAAISAP
jgi:putative ABC transport system permease protein